MEEEINQKLRVSSRKRRIAAFIIDHFTITFLLVSTVFLSMGTSFLDNNDISKMTITMLAVMPIGFLIYFVKDSIKGISMGKWIMGIMIRDADELNQVPSFGRLLIRNLLIIIWPVEFIVLALSQEKKRLGDKIVNTIVVNNPNKPNKLPRIIALIGVGITFFTFIILFVGVTMKSSEAYKVAIIEIEQNQEILSETGGIKGYGIMPTGNISITGGNGQAQLGIKVLGNEKDLKIRVYLTKESNEKWKLVEMNK
ncbi:RDD family protein [Mariniphaga sediminis]|uniref:RDD family protein n=1 Tax=Mariniphaga sediminis TaxID=1628158 RepID=A0A399D432_9BACT|nr:RDD family protein [Mariniphaga sediminis]RIH66674.1 RDD family protein [Mariniphaga sediminis]